jgi:hypothetical protein
MLGLAELWAGERLVAVLLCDGLALGARLLMADRHAHLLLFGDHVLA